MNEQTRLWAGASAGVGAFLAAVLPGQWLWYLQLTVVAVAGIAAYGIAKRYARRS